MNNLIDWLTLYGPTLAVGIGAIVSTICDRRNNVKSAKAVGFVMQANNKSLNERIDLLTEEQDLIIKKLEESEKESVQAKESYLAIQRRLARIENKIDRKYEVGE